MKRAGWMRSFTGQHSMGVPQDDVEAYACFNIGAAPSRDDAATWITNAELGRAQGLAAEYRNKYVALFRN